MVPTFVAFLATIAPSYAGFFNAYHSINTISLPHSDDVGEPLIVTKYLENNQLQEARDASLVHLKEFEGVPSYTGFFTVDKAFDSNLFFWFVPSQGDYEKDPVLLWLQGGPGSSSLFGLFGENGPYQVINGDKFNLREYAWTENHSIIYIDSPAGTGYSFTNGGFAHNQTKVGEDLYEALVQFFKLFPELQDNPFFITGESYAGKYIPAISYTIHKNNPLADVKINLKGLLIGNGLTDPENQITQYGNVLYETGLIDDATKDKFIYYQNQAVEYIRREDYFNAFYMFDIILNGDFTYPTLFKNATGMDSYFNFVNSNEEDDSFEEWIQTESIRKAIHVGNLPYNSDEVEENLREDIMKSVAPWIVELLNHYRVLFYNGQLDIIVAYSLTVNFIKKLEFSSAAEYKSATRNIWRVDNEIAGYVKEAGNLTELLVRNAGHMVPLDQPKWAFNMVYNFVREIPLV